jgi:hypothetical protein
MRMFEEKEFTGPLAEYLNACKPHRVEAIYNSQYRYVKEIVYDEDMEKAYGDTREGYNQFRRDVKCSVSHAGEVSLRDVRDAKGELTGYITETKLTSNEGWNLMYEQYESALEKTKELLGVEDEKNFQYWMDNSGECHISTAGANEIVNSIKSLEGIIEDYQEDEDFRRYLDKIKG